MGQSPHPGDRYAALRCLRAELPHAEIFVTVEPILDFDRDEFVKMLVGIAPTFVNIGCDSKNNGLPEPKREKIICLIRDLVMAGIKVRIKSNLTSRFLIDQKMALP